MSRHYEVTEEDIQSMIRYLEIYDPENANREWAITVLEGMQEKFHKMAHDNPEELKKMYEELKKSKKSVN